MPDNILLGKKGEEIAAKYLQKNGYRIIERNFKKRYGEIDIVAIDLSADSGQDVLVFVEVKTRYINDFVSPEESITPWKIKSLKRTAEYYKMLHPNSPELMRIDFVGVKMENDGKVSEINLIKNISS